jgi:hypothetical protein
MKQGGFGRLRGAVGACPSAVPPDMAVVVSLSASSIAGLAGGKGTARLKNREPTYFQQKPPLCKTQLQHTSFPRCSARVLQLLLLSGSRFLVPIQDERNCDMGMGPLFGFWSVAVARWRAVVIGEPREQGAAGIISCMSYNESTLELAAPQHTAVKAQRRSKKYHPNFCRRVTRFFE